MTVPQAVILGLIQGLTEFLPVSSSGHLVIAAELFGIHGENLSFAILVHLATAVAAAVMLWKEISWIVSGLVAPRVPGDRARAGRILWLLVLASVPAAAVGLIARDTLEALFSQGKVAAAGLIITGTVLYLSRHSVSSAFATRASTGRNSRQLSGDVRMPQQTAGTHPVNSARQTYPSYRKDRSHGAETVSRRVRADRGAEGGGSAWFQTVNGTRAFLVGLAQAVAIVPGISRSGMTVSSGLMVGMSRDDAVKFSFLLSLPAVAGGALLDYIEITSAGPGSAGGLPALWLSPAGVAGAASAFLAALVALATVFLAVRKGHLWKFAIYCWAAGALALAVFFLRG